MPRRSRSAAAERTSFRTKPTTGLASRRGPYVAASRLVDIGASTNAAVSGLPLGITSERLDFFRGQTDLFERVEAYRTTSFTLSGDGEPLTLVDLLSTDEGADIDFEPDRLGLTARLPEL